MAIEKESELYEPVKTFFEERGFQVRGEVYDCDLVAKSGNRLIGVELKLRFVIPLLYQAISRMSVMDEVFVAVPVPEGKVARKNWDNQLKDAVRLCKTIGIGLITIHKGFLQILCEPTEYRPKRNKRARQKLLSEFTRRSGDHNLGGQTGSRPRVTAYREDSLRLVRAMVGNGPMKGKDVRDASGVEKATTVMRNNFFKWFRPVSKGVYEVTAEGVAALDTYSDVVAAQAREDRQAVALKEVA